MFDYYSGVTAGELKRQPAKLGCTFEEGTKHLAVYCKSKRTLMARHPSKEIKTGTYHTGTYPRFLKKLGIKG
jgi:hypothetical protein